MSQSPKFISNINIVKDEKDKSNTSVNSLNYNSIVRDMSIGLTAYETVCSPREISDESKVSFTQEQINKAEQEAKNEIERWKKAQDDIAAITNAQEARFEALLEPLKKYEMEQQERLFYTIQVPDEYKEDINFLITTVSQKV